MKQEQHGLGLTEMMIAMSLCLGVILIGLHALNSATTSFLWHSNSAALEESASYAIEVIGRSVWQAAYIDPVQKSTGSYRVPIDQAVRGVDAATLSGTTHGIDSLSSNAVNGSDILVLRFEGALSEHGDKTLNCAGFAVKRATSVNDDAGWNIFHVAQGSSGEPELRCKYRGSSEWNSQAIVSGVESFQVLYGVDADGDGMANQYLNAAKINSENDPDSYWQKIVAIRISLLICSPQASQETGAENQFDLFGASYAKNHAAGDKGTSIELANLKPERRNRLRRVVESTIYLRNFAGSR